MTTNHDTTTARDCICGTLNNSVDGPLRDCPVHGEPDHAATLDAITPDDATLRGIHQDAAAAAREAGDPWTDAAGLAAVWRDGLLTGRQFDGAPPAGAAGGDDQAPEPPADGALAALWRDCAVGEDWEATGRRALWADGWQHAAARYRAELDRLREQYRDAVVAGFAAVARYGDACARAERAESALANEHTALREACAELERSRETGALALGALAKCSRERDEARRQRDDRDRLVVTTAVARDGLAALCRELLAALGDHQDVMPERTRLNKLLHAGTENAAERCGAEIQYLSDGGMRRCRLAAGHNGSHAGLNDDNSIFTWSDLAGALTALDGGTETDRG